MSQHLEHMSVGDTIDVRGPSGKLTYMGKGKSLLLFIENICVSLALLHVLPPTSNIVTQRNFVVAS